MGPPPPLTNSWTRACIKVIHPCTCTLLVLSVLSDSPDPKIPTFCKFKGECNVFLKKIILWMKSMHYPNTLRSRLVTIVPMAPFTPKSTSKLRSALHFRYSVVIRCFYSCANTAQSQNHYNHGFPNTFDYNHYVYSDYLVCSLLSDCYCSHYTLLNICDIIATMKIKGLYNI